MSRSKKALIVGGGVAGPVAAMALEQAGIDPVVYEAYADGAGAQSMRTTSCYRRASPRRA
jgi:2-polyprenyl-6-methoxyphenol hydroxylase-like FAD-dependent oxidoreductase